MVDCREGRDCEHGRQIGKCGDCEYQELLGELSYIRSERDALKAELDAARKQAPVGYFYLLDFSDTTIYKDKEGDENYAPLYASPVPTHPWNLITNENWNIPKLEQRVILFSNGVVQDESYTLDRGDDGYFWWREDLDECPEVKEGDAWIPWPSGPTL